MSTYSDKALQVLKDRGYRITNPRKLIVTLLDKTEDPLSAFEIKDSLIRSGEKVDLVSIYRIIDCLLENNLVHKLLSNGKIKKCQIELESECQRHQEDHCHHFLICRHCQSVQEIHCVGLEPLTHQISLIEGFQVEHHHLEFTGLCKNCL
ncbi:MAG: transcriptional repressor [Cyanobacteria bacterium]|nr:transcriptional repressor [Cyanobacteriota bacterium]